MKSTEQRIIAGAIEELIRDRAASTAEGDHVADHLERILARNDLVIVPAAHKGGEDRMAVVWANAYDDAILAVEAMKEEGLTVPALTGDLDTIANAVEIDDVLTRLREHRDQGD